jgi:hypothetical protein
MFATSYLPGYQSNMEFSMANILDREASIANSHIDGLRLFAVQKNGTNTENPDDLLDVQYKGGWVQSSPQTVCGSEYDSNHTKFCMAHCGPSASVKSFARKTWGYFSAVCFIHGRELVKATGRPQGMLESCWGGQTIESFSSLDAAKACGDHSAGSHYTAMISPILQFTIRGALWYQGVSSSLSSFCCSSLLTSLHSHAGEANSGSVSSGNHYACQMKALINDWRSKWSTAPTNTDFPFIVHQLSAYSGGKGLPAVRWAQYGAAHGPGSLPNVGVTIGTDLSDPHSPCGNVHIRNKTAVGNRMAIAARALAYNESIPYTGPLVKAITAVDFANLANLTTGSAAAISVTFDTAVQFETIAQTTAGLTNFEVTSDPTLIGGWKPATAVIKSGDMDSMDKDIQHDTVTVSPPRNMSGAVSGVRYSWSGVPSGQFLYDATARLPAGPFIAKCDGGSCRLINPGQLPGPPTPPPSPPPTPNAPSTQCNFQNNTQPKSTSFYVRDFTPLGNVSAPVCDIDVCCGICRADAKCAGAYVYHGPSHSAKECFCELYTATEVAKGTNTSHAKYPTQQVWITPQKEIDTGYEHEELGYDYVEN